MRWQNHVLGLVFLYVAHNILVWMFAEKDKLNMKNEQAEAAVTHAQKVQSLVRSKTHACRSFWQKSFSIGKRKGCGASEGKGLTATACSSRCG